MIRHLLLISFIFIHPVDAEEGHLVKSGDTLWSIARENNLSLNEIISFNEFRTFKNGEPIINPGDLINLSRKFSKNYKDICFDPNFAYHYNFSQINNVDLQINCLTYLEQDLDDHVVGKSRKYSNNSIFKRYWYDSKRPETDKRFWEIYLSDERYPYFFYNILLLL